MKRSTIGAGLGAAMFIVAMSAASAQLQTPYTAYGVGLEVGATVEAFIGGTSCGSTVVDPDGNWLLQIGTSAPCSPSAGDTVSFRVGGQPAEETVTFQFGGAPEDVQNGITLTVTESSTPSGVFSAELVTGVNLVQFNGTHISEAQQAAPGATFAVTIGGEIVTYIPGAPNFVNATFLAQYPGGDVPSGTLMFVVVP